MSPLVAGLEDARKRLGGWAASVAKTGAVVSAAGGAILTPLLALMKGAIDRDKAAGGLAGMLGTSAEQASRLAYAFSTVGIEQESVAHFTRHLARQISEAGDGSKEAQEHFARLGLAWQDLAGMDNLVEQLAAVGDAVGRIADPARRSAVAIEFFGRSGLDALKLFRGGGEQLRARMEEAGEVGAVVTDEMAKQAKEVMRAWNKMGAAIHNAWLEVGQALIPSAALVKQWTDAVVKAAAGAREWVKENGSLVVGLAGVGAALSATGTAILTASAALKILSLGGGLASAAAGYAASAFGLLVSPVGLTTAAVVGLTTAWALWTDSGQATVGFFGRVFGEMRDTAVEAWGGIVSALKQGDLAAAGEIAWAGLQVAWLQAVVAMSGVWDDFTGPLKEGWAQTCEFVSDAWSVVSDLYQALTAAFAPVVEMLWDAWQAFAGFFQSAWEAAVNFFQGSIATAARVLFDVLITPAALGVGILKSAWDGFASWFGDLGELMAGRWETVFSRMYRVLQIKLAQLIGYMLTQSARLLTAIGAEGWAREYAGAATFFEMEQNRLKGEIKAADAAVAFREREREFGRTIDEMFAEETDSTKALTAAKEALAAAIGRVKAAEAAGGPAPGKGLPRVPALEMSGVVKGLFSAPNYAAALAIGDKMGKKQYEMTREVRDAVNKVVAKLDKMDVVFG